MNKSWYIRFRSLSNGEIGAYLWCVNAMKRAQKIQERDAFLELGMNSRRAPPIPRRNWSWSIYIRSAHRFTDKKDAQNQFKARVVHNLSERWSAIVELIEVAEDDHQNPVAERLLKRRIPESAPAMSVIAALSKEDADPGPE